MIFIILFPFLILGVIGAIFYFVAYWGNNERRKEEYALKAYFEQNSNIVFQAQDENNRSIGFATLEGLWNSKYFKLRQFLGAYRGPQPYFIFSFKPKDQMPFTVTPTHPPLQVLLYGPQRPAEENKIDVLLADGFQVTSRLHSLELSEARIRILKAICRFPTFLNMGQTDGNFEVTFNDFPFSILNPDREALHSALLELLENFSENPALKMTGQDCVQ
jgi:hypothetical protein